MAQTTSISPGRVVADNVAVSVPAAGNTTLLEVDVADVAVLGLEIVVATQALDAFLIQGRMSASGTFQTLYSAAADFTAPAGAVVDASGDLTTLAAGASGWVMLNTLGLHSVKVLASAAVNNAAVTIRAIGKG